jgi:hypothetical protein
MRSVGACEGHCSYKNAFQEQALDLFFLLQWFGIPACRQRMTNTILPDFDSKEKRRWQLNKEPALRGKKGKEALALCVGQRSEGCQLLHGRKRAALLPLRPGKYWLQCQ